jgi:pimeloyl-ACP methyl ester carboxylesterase
MLSFKINGNGPPLLLLHGWGVTYTIWRELTPLLSPFFRLIMVELPGMGSSPPANGFQSYYPACATMVEEVRQSLGIEQWAVLSYSTGTRAAEAYVQRYWPHISRMVLLCPALVSGWNWLSLRGLNWLDERWPQVGNWVLSGWRLAGLTLALGFNGRYHPYTADWIVEIGDQPVNSLKAALRELPGGGRAPLALPPLPTLFVWGNRDIVMSRPRRPGPHNCFIAANHSAPMLAAPAIARVVLPFLRDETETN